MDPVAPTAVRGKHAQALANGFKQIARDIDSLNRTADLEAITKFADPLLNRLELGGRLVVCSGLDPLTPHLAHHFVEEARVRYKSGSPHSRPDRRCLPTLEVDGHKGLIFPFNENDNVIVFNNAQSNSFSLVSDALDAKANVLVLGASGKEPAEANLIKFSHDTLSATVQGSLCLHALCEYLEPEPPIKPKDMATQLACLMDKMSEMSGNIDMRSAVAEFRLAVRAKTPIFVIGNGGSTCDSELICTLIASQFAEKKIPLHIECPVKGGQTTCAWNDGFTAFKRTLEGFGDANHPVLVIGLTTSGNSKNLAEVFEYLSNTQTGRSIALLGKGGGPIGQAAKANSMIIVPDNNGAHIQGAQLAFGAMLGECFDFFS